MDALKKILFFILLPIYGLMLALMTLTFKWWEELLQNKPDKPEDKKL